jgi:hypothetical protein
VYAKSPCAWGCHCWSRCSTCALHLLPYPLRELSEKTNSTSLPHHRTPFCSPRSAAPSSPCSLFPHCRRSSMRRDAAPPAMSYHCGRRHRHLERALSPSLAARGWHLPQLLPSSSPWAATGDGLLQPRSGPDDSANGSVRVLCGSSTPSLATSTLPPALPRRPFRSDHRRYGAGPSRWAPYHFFLQISSLSDPTALATVPDWPSRQPPPDFDCRRRPCAMELCSPIPIWASRFWPTNAQ